MDSPIARSLISSLAFKSLTSGAFNFFRVGIFFLPYTRGKESLVDIPFIPVIKSGPLLHFHRRLDKIFDIFDSLKTA